MEVKKQNKTDKEIDDLIKSTLSTIFKNKIDGLIVKNNLVLIVYNTLKKLYIDDCDNVTISAPTGSGKSIISYLLAYASEIITPQLYLSLENEEIKDIVQLEKSYILTSSLILQNQINNDIEKFKMSDINILMGSSNYECINDEANKQSEDQVMFNNRPCLGLKKNKIGEHFKCFTKCPYYTELEVTATSNLAVLNYAYWLKAVPNVYFPTRFLTVCDEAHLAPEIIANTYSTDISHKEHKRILDCIQYLYPTIGVEESLKIDFSKIKTFFNNKEVNAGQMISYIDQFIRFLAIIKDKMDFSAEHMKFNPAAKKHKNAYGLIFKKYYELKVMIEKTNPDDLFIQSIIDDNLPYGFSYTVRNLNEKHIIKEKFINKTVKTVFLSATYGNMNTFSNNFEFKNPHRYRLESDFDFSKSPIYLTESGWLNYTNFENNINTVLADVFKLIRHYKGENGIIHTGTHYISSLIKRSVEVQPDIKNRFLFYENAKEKEIIVNKLKNATKLGISPGYILVGPSLYEGLDLKDAEGRLNIIVKAPYLGMDDYVKRKMKRYPDWYFNNCLQKIEQAIGRTNRHKKDWSHVYLLDSSLKKCLLSLNKTFIDRLQYKKLNRL